jgi:beta-N-acetylhexosaminidase
MPKSKSDSRQSLGQLLIVGFDGTAMSARLRSMLTRIQPAGVILFARNIVSAEQTYQLLKDCQSCVSTPVFTCVDMEGGTVDRFRNVLGATPSASDVFATGSRKLFFKHGAIIGKACRTLGFNTDFAPVVDLAFAASRTVMASRAVSADPKQVTLYAREFLSGLRSAGIVGAAKHFPGLGAADLDTHKELPSVKRSFKELWNQDIAPYRALRRDAPMVLVSHAAYPAFTRDITPASLSKKWITEILRKKIQYRGLIISDDLEMGGVLKATTAEQAAVEHIRAGGDIGLVCHLEERVLGAYEGLVNEAERDPRFARRCRESIARVLAFKRRNKALKRRVAIPKPAALQKLSRELWEFGEQVRMQSVELQNFSWQEHS